MRVGAYFFAILFLMLSGVAPVQAETKVLEWDDLVPKLFTGQKMKIGVDAEILGMPSQEEFQGVSKEELEAFLGDIEFMKDMQPPGAKLNGELDGKTVRIPGYVTPVGFDGEDITEFLLVPFLGACIHVPPPPANQIVYVPDAKGLRVEDVWEPIWLTGKMTTKSVATVLADVGYTLTDGVVEPYDAYPEDIREAH